MSGEALYERYKDALKRGHVASLRGRLEEALTAYAEAAAIAPERATPHVSAGTALMRRKRPADALRHYIAALSLAARDEAALLGRAQALTALDRRPEAADAFDALAEARSGTGNLADAVDAARRGLELAEGRERRRMLERLIARLRASEPGEPGRIALERALLVLEGMAVGPTTTARPATTGTPPAPARAGAGQPALGESPATTAGRPAEADPASVPATVDAGTILEPEAAGAVEAELPFDDAAEAPTDGGPLEPVAPDAPARDVQVSEAARSLDHIRAALDRDLPRDADAAALGAAAEAAIDVGDAAAALERYLDIAALQRRAGRIDAALDACYLALSLDPDNVGLHLGLVALYDERG
ncbi:MAG: hypothetical protein ABIR11_10695, partial [Candidatus Limnocylindrales bacterium]